MPSHNIVRQYVEGGYYHIYNRGVEKRDIFLDEQDYIIFLRILRSYLVGEKVFPNGRKVLDLSHEVELISYCLMPNHYHLLIRQLTTDGTTKFMRRAMTSYSLYFNRRHNRVGTLFQAHFKAAHITTDEHLIQVGRYIRPLSKPLLQVIDPSN